MICWSTPPSGLEDLEQVFIFSVVFDISGIFASVIAAFFCLCYFLCVCVFVFLSLCHSCVFNAFAPAARCSGGAV